VYRIEGQADSEEVRSGFRVAFGSRRSVHERPLMLRE
jgi:hypothetical protein